MSIKVRITGKRFGTLRTDKDDLCQYEEKKWSIGKGGYLRSTISKIYYHRLIMNAPDYVKVDHINRIRLDNRKSNLRFVTSFENAQNKSKRKNATSRYFGVCFSNNKYLARFKMNGKTIHIGVYDIEMDAVEAYDMYIVKHELKFKPVNFISKIEDYKNYLKNNPKIIIPKTSQYKGVSLPRNKYIAQITINKEKITLLWSFSEIECAKAYDSYIVTNNINRPLNFPENHPGFNPTKEIRTLCEVVDDNRVRLVSHGDNFLNKDDYERLKHYSSHIAGDGYIIITIEGGKCVRLNRFVMGVTDENIHVDHWDRNKLNNCKENLRIISQKNNNKNKTKAKNKTSKYIGVMKPKNNKKWLARICYDDISTHIGSYNTEEEAGRARDLYVLCILKDEYYSLNFKWTDEEIKQWSYLIGNHIKRLIKAV